MLRNIRAPASQTSRGFSGLRGKVSVRVLRPGMPGRHFPLAGGPLAVPVPANAGPQAGEEPDHTETGQHDNGRVHRGDPANLVALHYIDPDRHHQAPEALTRADRQAALCLVGTAVRTLCRAIAGLNGRRRRSFAAPAASQNQRHRNDEKPVLVIGGTEGPAHGSVLSYPAQQLLGTHDQPFSLPGPAAGSHRPSIGDH